ncbi:HNH endonuclease family protein [Actinosynnema sp. NPDC023587]|uniref:HNH endonuclease family protein n=1 Tax=Actinosynnema sp. NPDC023587 TaxID=3154695 RepID=UPI0033E0A3DB
MTTPTSSPRPSALISGLRTVPVTVVLALAAACATPAGVGAPAAADTALSAAVPAAASTDPEVLLARLGQARPEDTGAHYDRDMFGTWTTDPATGCDTRETVLARDGIGVLADPATCRPSCPDMAAPCWISPYDDVRTTDPRRLDVDHVVALAEAVRSGARSWTDARRRAFATDPANLLAVSASSNRSKGDDDPGRWRPPARASWCRVATTTITVKAHYGLHADADEHAALAAMLRTC